MPRVMCTNIKLIKFIKMSVIYLKSFQLLIVEIILNVQFVYKDDQGTVVRQRRITRGFGILLRGRNTGICCLRLTSA